MNADSPATETLHLKSTSIEKAAYDRHAKTLVVTFRPSGKSWRYEPVPRETFRAFVAAESPGQYFRAFIKNRFQETPL